MNSINLSKLSSPIEGITKHLGGFMAEAASYCLMSQGHQTGVKLKLKTDSKTEEFNILWSQVMTSDLKRTMNDEQRATEFGAMGMAVLLTLKLTTYKVFETSRKGTGIDFWLYKDLDAADTLDLSKAARLEVSGIFKASKTNTVEKRTTIKINQSLKSKNTTKKAYISIFEFGKPKSSYVTK